MSTTHEKLSLLAKDLTKEFPRSPRATLGGYVLAARALDKCRAELVGKQGEYHYNCPLDRRFFEFSGIDAQAFKDYAAEGRTDTEFEAWISQNARKRERAEVIQWNNQLRDLRLSELPAPVQEYMEDYVAKFIPRNRVIYHWFDIFDIEEQRL